MRVLGGVGVGLRLLHVLDRDQADRAVVVVHHDQPLDLVPTQQVTGFRLGDSLADRHQIFVRHQGLGRDI